MKSKTDFRHVWLLIFLCFLFPFGLLETELAVIHKLAHGGIGIGGDLYQVKLSLLGDCQSFLGGLDTELLAVVAYKAYLGVADLFVDLMTLSANYKTPPK